MRPRSRPILALGLALACQSSQTDTSAFTTMPGPGTTDASTSSTSSTSTSTTGDLSTSSSTSSTSTGGVTLLDVGNDRDAGSLHPEGCKGKIDFLFVISRFDFMEKIQAQLTDAVPKFLDTIQTKFADFDYHIMVVKGDPWWGAPECTSQCPMHAPGCDGYPCDLVNIVTACDETWGAGAVFNAGNDSPQEPCTLADGRRYLTRDHPDLPETFACIAKVGTDGGDLLGKALVHALTPELNGPGGCNEGFLRDDALLVVTLATVTGDDNSEGTPAGWAQTVIDAKGGDEKAVVVFGIHSEKIDGECWSHQGLNQSDRVCEFVERFSFSHSIGAGELDYGPGFDVATSLVETACSEFIPK